MNWAAFRRLRFQLAGAMAIVLILVWAAVAYQLKISRDNALDSARRHGENMTGAVAEHFALFTESVDSWMRHLADQWTKDSRRFAEIGALQKGPLAQEQLLRISVIDAQGRLAYSEPPDVGQPGVHGERERFRVPKDGGADRLHIGKPLKERASEETVIEFTRLMRDAKGRFLGELVLSISAPALIRTYESIDLGAQGFVTLRYVDGTVLLRSRNYEQIRGLLLPHWRELVKDGSTTGSFIRVSVSDGLERVFSFRHIKGTPLIAVVAQPVDAVLARYYEERRVYVAGGALISVVLVSLVLILFARLEREEQAERRLRESEARYRALSDLSADAYWEQDAQYRFTMIRPGQSSEPAALRQDMLGKAAWDLPHVGMTDEDWRAHREVLDRHQAFRDLVLKLLDADGRLVFVSLSGHAVFDGSGVFKGYRGVVKDVTREKRGEQLLALEHTVTLRLSEASSTSAGLKGVMQAVCESLGWECGRYFRLDEKAGVLRFAEAWSVPGEELERFTSASHTITFAPGVSLVGRAWQSGELQWSRDFSKDPRAPLQSAARVAGIRGAFVPPVILEGKVIGVFTFNSREVREPDERLLQATRVISSQVGQFLRRKHAERVLRESEERFNLAVRATNDVIWDWHLASDALWWNENIAIFGYRREDIEPTGKSWRERIHPEDRERVVTGIQAHIESGGESWSDEYRFRRKDGGYAVVFDRGHLIRDQAGSAARMIGAMADITLRKQAEERLAYLAQFDSLTGLPNRHLFRDRLAQTMERARRNGSSMALLFIDLDRFKLVNDTLGHGAGDRLLKEATGRLQACVRAADTVGRFGGDEFGAILSDLAEPGDASIVAQKIIDSLARPFELDGHATYVTASIGIALFPADSEEPATLIRNADVAMYRAKERGRNNYQYFTRELNERAQQRVQIETALRHAAERGQFLLHYQPKLELAGGALCGLEALLRWQHPERGLVPPLEFIPVLEETGLVVPVGEWVMGEVCAQIKAWQKSGLSVPPVAINISARQFQQKDLEITVRRILRDAGLDPSLIQFELTESLLMQDPEAAARTLGGLKQSGVKISVDDFGTGYSSLAYLRRFPIDALKIDRAFIRDIITDPDDAAITLAIIGLAHSLKLKVIAEGVETESQLEFLSAHACDEVQGFLFSKPVAPEACARMLREGVAGPRLQRTGRLQARR
jgi:diguanylate cyclase (GGDEF)-like protein/PAS domain S-box-containing protein